MSLFFRSRPAESRAVTSLPWSHGGDARSASGSMESQLGLVPVYAATRLIADAVSSLPLQQFRKTADGRAPMPLAGLFEEPSNVGTRVDWLQRAMTSLLLQGNAYGLKVGVDGVADGRVPRMIEWLNPERMEHNGGRWFYNGEEVSPRDLLHVPAMVVPGRATGLSPIGACSATMQAGLETQRFMKDWYRNKAVPGMVFKNTDQTITAEAAAKAKERLKSTLRAGDPFVTGKDWDLDVIKLSADDAGFVSSSKLTATQVATIFGVPAEMIGGETGSSLHYTTTEQNQIHFITHTLRPWLVRLETAFSSLLPKPQYVKFNVDALIRVDLKARYEVHRISREIGLNNIDELRALEDQDPLPGGQGQDYTPLRPGGAVTPQGDVTSDGS